jgi:predicted N-formylglutamate amidohydrolase
MKFTGSSANVLLKGDCLTAKPLCIVITCEHGGNRIPKQFTGLFRHNRELLESHRGHDPGAINLAKKLSHGLKAPLYYSRISRLVIDLNRSPRNPARFSEITRRLGADEKTLIQELYYAPYRAEVKSALLKYIGKGGQVLHLSIHTFTPMLHGRVRMADLGLLYDPSRRKEASFCILWQKVIRKRGTGLRARRNYPYRGTSDGFTAYLRDFFPEDSYLGIELEVNQKFLSKDRKAWLDLQQLIMESLERTRSDKGMNKTRRLSRKSSGIIDFDGDACCNNSQ